MRNNPFPFWLFLFAYGVFGADGVKSVSVSVMVGDSVTLHTDDTETQRVLELVWKIQGENKFIAEIDKEINKLSVPGNEEEPFKGRLKLDNRTDSLTITNLKTTDSRVYELQIKTTKETKSKIFNVDVSDGMKTVSVKEGEPVSLHTGLIEIKEYDLILWTFENHLIARINRTTNQFVLFSAEGKFEGRLQRVDQSGSLTIHDSRTTDSGDYHLNMGCSTYTLQRTIRVTVKNSGLSPGVIAGICAAVAVGLVILIGCCYFCCK
uniref:Immunoglobulin domain-containing protein n=1 Tax=Cyprinus carpio TaxID=7962 RepID=A0A8C2H676_CYPCA